MAPAEDKAMASDWTTVDTSELSAETGGLYAEMKAAYRLYAEAKAKFEAQMQEDYAESIAEGEELKFGYKFGKLSITTGPAIERRAAPKAKQGLSAWLAARQANGHSC